MKILNFGSLNVDYVYSVPHIVHPSETISSHKLETFAGGKGLNQSVAFARAGAKVYHAGLVGENGDFLKTVLQDCGVDVSLIENHAGPNGHAIIQVSDSGQNSIIIYGGANHQISEKYIDRVLENFGPGDLLVLQNEINMLPAIIDKAYEQRMIIALNPSPINESILACRLEKISYFIVNEIEGKDITGETKHENIMKTFATKYPASKVVLTLGKAGVLYFDGNTIFSHKAYNVNTVDTTAAGDTFLGYFMANIFHETPEKALQLASIAAALAVSVKGASPSIPDEKTVRAARLGFVPTLPTQS